MALQKGQVRIAPQLELDRFNDAHFMFKHAGQKTCGASGHISVSRSLRRQSYREFRPAQEFAAALRFP
jgi:hypothetical protein